jgi:subfamily B ATP-binding cassette protein HlyB/CyaB
VARPTLVMKNDGFTVGMLVAFQMFANRLSQPVLRLVGLWWEFQQAAIAVARVGDIMNAPAEPVSYTSTKSATVRGS